MRLTILHSNCRLATVFCMAIAVMLTVDLLLRPFMSPLDGSSCVSKQKHHHHFASSGALELRIGDLPGYTGWLRPTETLAGWFELVTTTTEETAVAGQYWNVSVQCDHVDCFHSHSLFYVRAYGPSIVPGRVVQRRAERDGVYYDISVYFSDAGRYTVEAVLTFSNPPVLGEFPLPLSRPEQAYEGFLLPDFPLLVDVRSSSNADTADQRQRSCGAADLTESSSTSALERGRWIVVDKVASRSSGRQVNVGSPSSSSSTAGSTALLEGFKSGVRSLGVEMEFEMVDCGLPRVHLRKTLLAHPLRSRIHVVFIGDSNMGRQYRPFESLFGEQIRTSFVQTHKGLVAASQEILQQLKQFKQTASPDTIFVVLFNAGLHEIGRLCSQDQATDRRTFIGEDDATFSCKDQYRSSMTELVQAIQRTFPSQLVVFQTTTAAWMRWGNFGFAWPLDEHQTLPKDPAFVELFNDIARPIMEAADIPSMDAYYLTLARPDHREFSETNHIGGHMAHAGDQVYEVLLHKWLVMILEHLKKQ